MGAIGMRLLNVLLVALLLFPAPLEAYFDIKFKTDCSTNTGEGSFCWDTDNDSLYVGTGSSVVAPGGYTPGGTDVALADGGTGASLSDPGADRIPFWDDSAGAVTWLTPGSSLTVSDTDLNITTPIGIGDGGTGQTTRQAAIDALTNVSATTTGYVLTKDGSGNATFQLNSSSVLTDSTTNLYVTATGDDLVVGTTAAINSAKLSVLSTDDQVTGLLKMASGQTADALQIKNNADSTLASVDKDGDALFNSLTLPGSGAGYINAGTSDTNTLNLRAYDVDGTAYVNALTITSGNTPTFDLNTGTTIGSAYIYRASGTDVPLTDGGTGASLADPGANRLLGWDDTDNAVKFLTIGTGLSYDAATDTLSSSGGSGTSVWAQSTGTGQTLTHYYGMPSGGLNTTEANVSNVQVPLSGTVSKMYCKVQTAPGVGKSWAFTAREDAVDQALTCTISNAATSCSDTSNSFAMDAGDIITIKATASGSPTSSGTEACSVVFTPS